MFGWVLRKGIEGATGAKPAQVSNSDDTTQVDIPDTPAPVFAARAIKRAVFGTPAPPRDNTMNLDIDTNGAATRLETDATDVDSRLDFSPSKPTGILLTPGTSTSRRKTVTFRHDVKVNTSLEDMSNALSGSGRKSRPRRTKLTEAMEKSRRHRTEKPEPREVGSEDEDWVEEDDDGEPFCDHDLTVDLNEPHSRSGKYWKESFEKYHGEAKVEMEKLVKYKQLAKSYAKMKDTEAMELRLKLKEEQERVTKMEEGIASQASELATKMVRGEKETPEMMRGLAKHTALAVQYREQVKELEAMLKEREAADRDEARTERRTGRTQHVASPRTQKTILEAQRELRKARAQIRELGDVKQRLERVEARNNTLNEDNRRLREESTNTRDLERHVKLLKAESERKQEGYDNLRDNYETMKENAKARHGEATWVVQQKDEQIAELKKEVRALKTTSIDSGRLHKKLDGALLAESGRIIAELKKEVDLLGGSRKRSLGKKVDALAANMRSLGYEPETWEPTETKDMVLPPVEPGRRRMSELVNLPHDMARTETLEITSPEKRERPMRTVKLAATSSGTKVISSSSSAPARPKSMVENITGPVPTISTDILCDRVNREKLDALNERRERRWREFVPRDEKATIASLASGVAAELEAPTISVDGDGDYREKKYDEIFSSIKASPLKPRRQSSVANAAAGTAPRGTTIKGGDEMPRIDLVTDRFARLGVAAADSPNGSVLWANASKTSLPADRLSAALARIERRKMDRKKVKGGTNRGLDKENIRPVGR